jgi:hypothetical protein
MYKLRIGGFFMATKASKLFEVAILNEALMMKEQKKLRAEGFIYIINMLKL